MDFDVTLVGDFVLSIVIMPQRSAAKIDNTNGQRRKEKSRE
jgi:hypothetical protein